MDEENLDEYQFDEVMIKPFYKTFWFWTLVTASTAGYVYYRKRKSKNELPSR